MTRGGILETLVGIVVIIIAALFLFYAYSVSGRTLGQEAYKLDAVFGRVDGLATGSDVRMAGVKIGTVSEFSLDTMTFEARVSMMINNGVPVPDDSVAKVVSDGLLGGAHIALEPGASEYNLAAGETITITQGSVDLLGIAMQAFTANAGQSGQNSTNNDNAQSLPDFDSQQ